jgi:hypothetical protein
MLNARSVFLANIRIAREQSSLYDFLVNSVVSPFAYDDILRSQVVYSVSAFDKLIHDIIRVGMVATFVGNRQPTPKYHAEAITIELHGALLAAGMPPAELLFDQEVIKKLRILVFQDPNKVSDGLSLIWPEVHKWAAIAGAIGISVNDAKTTMKLISIRRNAIVHEADMDPVTNARTPISRAEANEITDFLEVCGTAIVNLVV